jgi:hypothetical protein
MALHRNRKPWAVKQIERSGLEIGPYTRRRKWRYASRDKH